jgi:YbgC/YbaW family acyl-CoA thioester hydrolase
MRFHVEFSHTDMGGVMFFGRYLELAHRAYEDFVQQHLGVDWNEWFNNAQWIVPIRALHVDYLNPLRGGSEGEVQAQIVKVGTSSFTHTYTFLSEGKNCAVVSLTSVFVEKSRFGKIPIPASLRQALENRSLASSSKSEADV